MSYGLAPQASPADTPVTVVVYDTSTGRPAANSKLIAGNITEIHHAKDPETPADYVGLSGTYTIGAASGPGKIELGRDGSGELCITLPAAHFGSAGYIVVDIDFSDADLDLLGPNVIAIRRVPPTVAEIDSTLTASHGANSWQQQAAAPTPSDIADEVKASLRASQGNGAWDGSNQTIPTKEQIAAQTDTVLTSAHGSGPWTTGEGGGGGGGGVAGPGASKNTITVVNADSQPLGNVEVWLSTDAAGANVVAGALPTNDAGQVAFFLDKGVTYYIWRDHPQYNFVNPTTLVAT